MARQTGLIKISGKIGDEVFFERNGEEFVRKAAKTKRQTENSKKSSAEFSAASSAVAVLRKALKKFSAKIRDSRFDDRLKKKVREIIETGPATLKGKRQITDGNLSLLRSFEVNKQTPVGKLVNFSPLLNIDKAELLTITLPKMNGADMFNYPDRLQYGIIEFHCAIAHFDLKKCGVTQLEQVAICKKNPVFPGGKFRVPLQAAHNSVVIVAMSVHFKNEMNLICGDRRFYAGHIVEAFNIVDGEIVHFQEPEPPAPHIVSIQEHRIKFELNEDE